MKLKDVLDGCLFADGDWIESKDQDPNGKIRLIQLADIGDGFFVDKSSRFINRETAKRLRCTFLKKGDILIARMPDPLGRACVFPLEENEKYVTAVDVCIIRTNENCNNRYLQYCLNSTDIRNSIERQKTGTTRERITRKKLGELEIPLPPLPQQQKIANILDAADALRQNDKALIAKYDELTQALFLDMFGDPVSNPKGWEKVMLGDISKISSGSTPSRENDSYYVGEIPWVKTGEVNGKVIYNTSEKISEEALTNSSCKLYPKGSLIIAMYGQGKTRGQIGMLGIDATTNQACGVIPPSDKMNFNFLFQLLQLNYEDLRSLGRGGNQPNLNSALLKSYEVINPSINLQNEFAERVAVIEEQKAIAQKSLEQSERLFNSLLQKAFKGEL